MLKTPQLLRLLRRQKPQRCAAGDTGLPQNVQSHSLQAKQSRLCHDSRHCPCPALVSPALVAGRRSGPKAPRDMDPNERTLGCSNTARLKTAPSAAESHCIVLAEATRLAALLLRELVVVKVLATLTPSDAPAT